MVSVIEPRAASVALVRSVAAVFGGAVNTARNRPSDRPVTRGGMPGFPWSKDTCSRVDAMREGGASTHATCPNRSAAPSSDPRTPATHQPEPPARRHWNPDLARPAALPTSPRAPRRLAWHGSPGRPGASHSLCSGATGQMVKGYASEPFVAGPQLRRALRTPDWRLGCQLGVSEPRAHEQPVTGRAADAVPDFDATEPGRG